MKRKTLLKMFFYAEWNRNIKLIGVLFMSIHLTWHFLTPQLYFEDEQSETLYQVNQDVPLLKVMQHKR